MRFLTSLIATFLACSTCYAATQPTASGNALQRDTTEVVRAWFDDPAMLEGVTGLLGHAQIDRAKGLLRTEADAGFRKQMEQAGFRVETDHEATAHIQRLQRAMAGDRSIAGFACYRTVEETGNDMDALAAAYPHLLSIESIGNSWQSPGYALKVHVATNAAIPGPKPKLFMLSSIHAREYTPAELGTRFIEDLVLGHGIDAEATWLLDHHEVHAVLQGNPDGRKRAETGLSWRKNHNITHCGGSNSAGVDLNRNYPFMWAGVPNNQGSSDVPCNSTFRGPQAQSEPETQAIVDYVRAQFDDRRGTGLNDPAASDTQGMFFDIHSFGGLVLWPWGFTSTLPPNASGLAALGRRLGWFNNYTAEQAVGLYPTDGTTDDFAYGELGLPAYTFELGSAFFQDCNSFETSIYPDNTAALRYAARSLQAPYLLPAGPDVFELTVQPDLLLAGQPVSIQGVLDDSRQQTRVTSASGPVPAVQNVISSTAWLGIPPWQPGATAIPMQPVDGRFDSPRESAATVIDTSGLAAGQHLVYVQGRDAAGNDGPPNAAFIDIIAVEDAVQLQGVVRQAGSGDPLVARVKSGRFEVSSAATGAYQRLLPAGMFDIEVTAPEHEPLLLFGLPGTAGALVTMDFELFPLCTLLDDPVDAGITSPFTAAAPWTVRPGMGIAGGSAWLPTQGASYANNLDTSLTSPLLDLSGYDAIRLVFDSRCDTEATYDFGRVEFSVNGGGSWSEVFRCDGDANWRNVEVALPALANAANAQLRFRFTSDGLVTAQGWAVDNIRLRAGGATCRASQPTPVRIDAFDASPDSIAAGAGSVLRWQTAHADSCHIDNDFDDAEITLESAALSSGQVGVSPAVSTQFQLVCEGVNGPVSATASVTVAPAPEPVAILTMMANPNQITVGEASVVSWQTLHADACSLTNDINADTIELDSGALASGQRSVSPSVNTRFTLTCEGPAGPVEADAIVSVSQSPSIEIISFDADPSRIVVGASSMLSWTTQNASSCRIEFDSGVPDLAIDSSEREAGSMEVFSATDAVYTLVCEGAAGPQQRQVSVQVSEVLIFAGGFEVPEADAAR